MGTTFESASGLCRVAKVDTARRLVWGWAMVSSTRKSADAPFEDYFDLQGDHVSDDDIIDMALEFAKGSRPGDDMHDGRAAGFFPFIMPIVSKAGGVDIAKELGIDGCNLRGLAIAYRPDSDETFQKFVDGTYTGFSFGGVGVREPVEGGAS